MSDDAKPAGWQPGALLMATPVLVYFLFPHLYLMPFLLINKSPVPLSPRMQALFAPVTFLADRFPLYEALLDKESDWTGIR